MPQGNSSTLSNSNVSNVNQSQSAFNFQLPAISPSVVGGVGVASSLYGSFDAYQNNRPLLAGLQGLSTVPYFQQQFPQTFNPQSYPTPAAQQIVSGLNTAGGAAQGGLSIYGLGNSLVNGNFSGALLNGQSLTAQGQTAGLIPDFNNAIQGATGIRPISYGNADTPTLGYAPYLTGALGAVQTTQSLKNKDYLGAGIGGAQTVQAAQQIYSSFFPSIAQAGGTAATSAVASGTGAVASGTGAAASGTGAVASGTGAAASGTGGAAASGTGGAAASGVSSTSSGLGSYAIPGLQIAAGLYGGYQTASYQADAPAGGVRNNMSTLQGGLAGASLGAGIGTLVPIPGVGTLAGAGIGFAVGAAVGYAGSRFGSSKGERQMVRDGYRKYIVESKNGLFGEDYQGTLADGSKFNFGTDNVTFDKGKDTPGNIDLSTDAGAKSAAFGDALASAQGFNGKQKEAVAALFASAALSNAKGDTKIAQQNLNHFVQKLGLDRGKLQSLLNQRRVSGEMSAEDYKVASSTLNTLADKGGDERIRQLSDDEITKLSDERKKQMDADKKGAKATTTDGTIVYDPSGKAYPDQTKFERNIENVTAKPGETFAQAQRREATESGRDPVGGFADANMQDKAPAPADPNKAVAASSGIVGEVPPYTATGGKGPGKYYTPDGKLATGIDPGFTQGNIFVPDGSTFAAEKKKPQTAPPFVTALPTPSPAAAVALLPADKVRANMTAGRDPGYGLSPSDVRRVFMEHAIAASNRRRQAAGGAR